MCKCWKESFPTIRRTSSRNKRAAFGFAIFDVDVYESAKDITNWVWERMVAGGIIVFDDYGFCGCEGIVKFVDEVAEEKDRLVFHNVNGHAIVVKLSPRRPAFARERTTAAASMAPGLRPGRKRERLEAGV